MNLLTHDDKLCDVVDFFKKTDLNCIVFFLAFMKYKTLYNTSIAMNCSPASVSLMLKKFRMLFHEPLFVREGRQLMPTTFAISLEKDMTLLFGDFVLTLNKERGNYASH